VVITLFRGQRLKIYAESSLGWTPIGKEFTVTDIRIDDEDCYIDFYGDRNFVENDSNDDFSVCKKSSPLPFEERIVNFLHATSRDLYLTNKKLEEAAFPESKKPYTGRGLNRPLGWRGIHDSFA